MTDYRLLAGIVILFLSLIWIKDTGVNLLIKLFLFCFGIWGVLQHFGV